MTGHLALFLNIALAQYESWVLQLKSTAYLLCRYVLHKWLRLWCQPMLAHGSVSQTRKTEWLQLLPRLMPRTLLPALRFLQHASGPSFSFAVAAADRGAPHDSLARKGLSKLADASYVLPRTTLLLGHGQLPLYDVLLFLSCCLLRGRSMYLFRMTCTVVPRAVYKRMYAATSCGRPIPPSSG